MVDEYGHKSLVVQAEVPKECGALMVLLVWVDRNARWIQRMVCLLALLVLWLAIEPYERSLKMKNKPQPSRGGFSDFNELLTQSVRTETSVDETAEELLALDYLLELGFEWEESVKLHYFRKYLYENTEIRQRIADDHRMHFVRWLYEHGEMSDF